MYVTREADYAVRCILQLSRDPKTVMSVNEISEQMHIPKSFLAKILQRLVKAGIVVSNRGVKGGFQLARKPKDVSLLEVIEAIQGPAAMNVCAINSRLCSLSNTCTVHPIWIEIRKDVEKKLRGISFAKLTSKALS